MIQYCGTVELIGHWLETGGFDLGCVHCVTKAQKVENLLRDVRKSSQSSKGRECTKTKRRMQDIRATETEHEFAESDDVARRNVINSRQLQFGCERDRRNGIFDMEKLNRWVVSKYGRDHGLVEVRRQRTPKIGPNKLLQSQNCHVQMRRASRDIEGVLLGFY